MNCLMLYWRYKETVVDVGGIMMFFYKTFYGSAAKKKIGPNIPDYLGYMIISRQYLIHYLGGN